MEKRVLGNSGLEVSALGLGCMRMSFGDAPIGTREEMITLLHQAVVDLLQRIGSEHDATPAQIALAWLLAQKPWIVPIPGSRKLNRLEENIASVNVQLTANDLKEIADAMAQIEVVGHRY